MGSRHDRIAKCLYPLSHTSAAHQRQHLLQRLRMLLCRLRMYEDAWHRPYPDRQLAALDTSNCMTEVGCDRHPRRPSFKIQQIEPARMVASRTLAT